MDNKSDLSHTKVTTLVVHQDILVEEFRVFLHNFWNVSDVNLWIGSAACIRLSYLQARALHSRMGEYLTRADAEMKQEELEYDELKRGS